ncbi:NAD-dependent epimerase/dehydratase family protein [Nonomuraea sp. NN258]|uniref:NAD-dependent epimerase/dehydratase family protein n=1 Tax=Nonomuraea antri TaxID=2730852 RepID=UPI00156A1031|nr:NAD-dependent epimerase/dehydratase family protein [Nonomuraea antri]NRQ33233.1 NAD-dependent epimerase/dehydratase family protein [Nonomuraea antri]
MKVLVFGATGYIGGVVRERLAEQGHEVAAFVRRPADGGERLPDVADERYGDLSDQASVAAALTDDVDAIVHAGQLTGDRELDLAVIGTLAGSGKKVVYVSGVWVLGATQDGDEDSPADPIPLVAYRPEVERLVLDAGGSVVRPGVVHGRGAGIPAILRAQAAQRGVGVYVTAGGEAPTWTFVHVEDLAELIVTVVEKGGASVYHGISEVLPVPDVAEAAAKSAGVRVAAEPWPLAEAAQVFGEGFAQALALSQRVGAGRTREELAWQPSRAGILDDLVTGSYI